MHLEKQVFLYRDYVLADLLLAPCSQTGRWPKVLALFGQHLTQGVNFIDTAKIIVFLCDNGEDKCAY